MLEILPPIETVVAMRASGRLTGEDVEKAVAAVEAALEKQERVSLYAEIEDSISITAEGFVKDVYYGFKNLRDLKRFYRAAAVTDNKWLATLVRAEGLMFSQIEIKVFADKEREAAMHWVSETPLPIAKPKDASPAIHILETDEPNVFAFEIDGHITGQDIKRVVEHLQPAFEKSDKIRVLGRFKKYDGFDFGAAAQDGYFALKWNALKKVERYAVVGAPVWAENLVELIDPLFKIEMKCFNAENETEAWAWINKR